ncbi:MAG TPA: hypothetical protein VFN09_02130 [Rhodanobacteraceae bacterium]|nr:hypothetical protein [Rhodanobacteraceae bacterium]
MRFHQSGFVALRTRVCNSLALLLLTPSTAFMAADVPLPDPGFGGSGDGIARVPFDITAHGSDVASKARVMTHPSCRKP